VLQNLASNGIGDTGAQAICNMLQNNVVITNLDLACMYVYCNTTYCHQVFATRVSSEVAGGGGFILQRCKNA